MLSPGRAPTAREPDLRTAAPLTVIPAVPAPAQPAPDGLAPAPPALFKASERGYTPLGTVNIPAIGLVSEFSSGAYDEVLARGIGHWPGTALPGQAGNAVLSGHRTTHTSPFRNLHQLQLGNHIGVTIGAGPEVVYQVTETLIVPESDYVTVVTAPASSPNARELTLFACHPSGFRTHRIVVRARIEGGGATT
ncbi:MAG: class E sortase [Egibacteraceae bacterium]